MESELKEFTEEGVSKVSSLLNDLRNRNSKWSKELKSNLESTLLDQDLTNKFSNNSVDQNIDFKNRFQFGKYLYNKIGDIDLEQNFGLLTWLNFFFFDKVFEIKPDNTIVYRAQYNYIPEAHQFRFYKHRIIAPYLAYKIMGEDAIVVLTNPTYEGGDSVNNWLSRTDFISNKKAIKLGRRLYFNEKVKSLKTAAFSENKKGNARDFAKNLIPQLMVNFDIQQCDMSFLFELLPEDYRQWLDK